MCASVRCVFYDEPSVRAARSERAPRWPGLAAPPLVAGASRSDDHLPRARLSLQACLSQSARGVPRRRFLISPMLTKWRALVACCCARGLTPTACGFEQRRCSGYSLKHTQRRSQACSCALGSPEQRPDKSDHTTTAKARPIEILIRQRMHTLERLWLQKPATLCVQHAEQYLGHPLR